MPQPKKRPKRPPKPVRKPPIDPDIVHRAYVERHLGGTSDPGQDAYDRALEQWHRLPGAVRNPPTETTPPAETPPPAEDRPAEDPEGDA
ncbi:MAG: hypothetical protein JWR63_4432 [Conexibacter sp.]|nr:hypothetical protein [Conexibacter sp.]